MSTTQTQSHAQASQSCCYLYWRAPSGFWMRRVRWEGPTESLPQHTLERASSRSPGAASALTPRRRHRSVDVARPASAH